MLVIRMQRTGRKGHAQFRVVVQDSRRTPTSGKIVALVGSYNPHSKQTNLDKEKAQFYLDHGAQPSPRVAAILKAEGVKLPKWVQDPTQRERTVRNPEKRRSTTPPAPVEEAAPEVEAETPTEAPAEEAPAEIAEETPAEATEAPEPEAAVTETPAPEEPAADTEPEA